MILTTIFFRFSLTTSAESSRREPVMVVTELEGLDVS
jgi:hypothetical protein